MVLDTPISAIAFARPLLMAVRTSGWCFSIALKVFPQQEEQRKHRKELIWPEGNVSVNLPWISSCFFMAAIIIQFVDRKKEIDEEKSFWRAIKTSLGLYREQNSKQSKYLNDFLIWLRWFRNWIHWEWRVRQIYLNNFLRFQSDRFCSNYTQSALPWK